MISDGRVKFCRETFVSTQIEATDRADLEAGDRNNCTQPGDVFSLQSPCDPRETGIQHLWTVASVTGISGVDYSQAKRYDIHNRSTFSASNVSAAERDELKKGAAELFKLPLGVIYLTPDLK